MQDSPAETQTPRSPPSCENESELGHSKTTEQQWSLVCLGRQCKAPKAFLQIFRGCKAHGCVHQWDLQKDKMSLGSPLQRAALRSVSQDFRKCVLIF